MSVLHHRSIVTHSLLLPLLLLFVKSNVTKPVVAGLCAGISIHLAADLLSPMKGFALVYLPAPIKSSIGSWQSFVWLGLNALAGLYLASRLTTFHRFVVPGVFAIASLWYAFYNEQNIFVLVPTAIIVLCCFRWPARLKLQGKLCKAN
ncbi:MULTISPECIES: hypothetical protein [Vibrio]|uniref:hypothetical protein n=1 Tax=Vibrio TaxID=662 RepID=UPI000C82DD73|nr:MULTISPECIES: hypothetical protein [Vibrio]PMI93947.1 hypothetical protein BCU33_21835 [Vibrio lentus]PTP95686.1 hypothetical protein CWO02_02215 [Vibrio splendidus]